MTIDVLAVIRAPLEQYPPSLNQVALLAQAGLRVGVVDTEHADYRPFVFSHPENVERYRGGKHVQLFKEPAPNPIVRLLRVQQFQQRTRSLIRRHGPKVVIAYDPNGMEAVGKLWDWNRPPQLIWHFHELFVNSTATGYFTRRAIQFSSKYADQANLVVFPDQHRAAYFCQDTRSQCQPMIVKNCPPRAESLPENKLPECISRLGLSPQAPIVFFQGWIGPSRCFEAIIRSMPYWPKDAIFVLVGPVSDQYRTQLLALANEFGVSTRIGFVGPVPYANLASLTVGATLGLSILSNAVEQDLSWKFSAGSTNKRFEYMSMGVPQIANRGPGMNDIIEGPDCGALVDPADPTEIGQTVHRLLSDPAALRRMSKNARTAHLTHFCLEEQTRDWLEFVFAAVGKQAQPANRAQVVPANSTC